MNEIKSKYSNTKCVIKCVFLARNSSKAGLAVRISHRNKPNCFFIIMFKPLGDHEGDQV